MSDQATIDEQLVTFRGRCKFRMFIPSKPGKYGIKIWVLADATNAYMYNAEVYIGKINGKPETNQGENVVKRLSQSILKTGRNITTDNFFTTLNLAKYLLEHKTTLVGTVRKNKKFLPEELVTSKGDAGQSKFYFSGKFTLVKYNGKKNKSVNLLSSQHHDKAIDASTGKPEIIHYYNSTKGGVDTLDQLIRHYSVKRATRRWPVALFYNIIDTAAYNAFVLYITKNPQFASQHKKNSRRIFLKYLADELLEDDPNTNFDETFDENEDPIPSKIPKLDRGRCHICQVAKAKSRISCDKCDNFVCEKHRKSFSICKHCL